MQGGFPVIVALATLSCSAAVRSLLFRQEGGMGSQEESGGLVAVMLKYFSSQPRCTGEMGGHSQQTAFNVFPLMNYCKCPKGEREGHNLPGLLKK